MFENTIAGLQIGESAIVDTLRDGGRNIVGRLRDLGFTEGSLVDCVGASPLGDPHAYRIRGAVIALRKADAACVVTRKQEVE